MLWHRCPIALAGIVLSSLAWSQVTPASLLLPSPVRLRGLVVDSDGAPIPGVRIDHIDLTVAFATGDSSGHFDFEAKGPSVVFRKNGWTSRLVRVAGATGELRIVMEKVGDPVPLPICASKRRCVTAGDILCLPRVRGVGVGEPFPTIDTVELEFRIHSWFGPDRVMGLGSGSARGGPEPSAQRIWRSVEFSEIQRVSRGDVVLDARGKTSDGKLWRSVGAAGEAASYYEQDPKDAALFDRVLDGLCLFVPDRK